MQTILKITPNWIQIFTLDSMTLKIKNCNSVSRMAPLTLITASSRCRMELIHYCKRRCGKLFQTLTMSCRSSARYLRLGNLRSLWMELAKPALAVLRWRLDKASRLLWFRSDMVIMYYQHPFCTQSDSFQTVRTVCALIRRPWFSVILEAVATAVLVLFTIWDRIIFWPCCLMETMCLGNLFILVTFPVTFTFWFNLRMVEGCLLNIVAT